MIEVCKCNGVPVGKTSCNWRWTCRYQLDQEVCSAEWEAAFLADSDCCSWGRTKFHSTM